MREVKSVCRYCAGACGVIVTLDQRERVAAVRGDRDHPLTAGYVCSKGVQSAEAMYGPQRLLRPLKRLPDGRFVEIPLEQALDEIGARMGEIIAQEGPEAIGVFKGTQTWKNPTAHQMINAWLPAIGSTRLFTTITIDQSAKQVTMCRMGYWDAGKPSLDECDVMLVVGGNPLVSVAVTNFCFDPAKRLKAAQARGMKLIVIDPRRTEIARVADCFLQCKPGEDPAIMAGIIRIILREGWHDEAFCAAHVEGLDALREAVEPFTPDYVAQRAGLDAERLVAAARMFALENKRGIATCGTGPSMAPFSNLSDHLTECLNAICGRYRRVGDRIPNPGVQNKRREHRAEVVAANRHWESGPKTSTGHGTLFGELMSGVIADEMLLQGEGRLRALLVSGGNPAAALPDQKKAIAGLRALDLLVAIEPYMTATAKLCDFILPPKLQFERTDTAVSPHYEMLIDRPFAQYVPPVAFPPEGAEVVDDWYPYWALAKRLGRPITLNGVVLDMETPPSTDDLLAILLKDAQVPFDEIRQHPEGRVFDIKPIFVSSARPGAAAKLQVWPDDIAEEMRAASQTQASTPNGAFTHTLTVRRLRGVMNSLGIEFTGARRLHAVNSAHMHPDDLAELRLEAGAPIEIESDHGRIAAVAAADDTVRRGVVSMSHCWGGLPDEALPYEVAGSSTNLLVRTDKWVERVNAMPRMSAIPVRVMKQRG